ncbi:MAG: hypothetical protein C0514_04525 [Candidatus Puniceispirillum sp.]|nr:hypothetical protein [Candidatus Puniceispirillum sp.]
MKNPTLLLMLALLQAPPLLATAPELDDDKNALTLLGFARERFGSWTDPRVINDNLLFGLCDLCAKEPACRKNPGSHTLENGMTYERGYSYGRLDNAMFDVLTKVRSLYEKRRAQILQEHPAMMARELDARARVNVLVLPGGMGFAAWKLIAAGARVTVAEPNEALHKNAFTFHWTRLQESMENANIFLPPAVEPKDLSTILKEDVLSVLAKPQFANAFDGVYMDHTLHLMSPQEARLSTVLAARVLGPKGHLWVREHSGFLKSAQGKDAAVYAQQLEAGKPFPGFMHATCKVGYSHAVTHTPVAFFPKDAESATPARVLMDGPYMSKDMLDDPAKRENLLQMLSNPEDEWRHRAYFLLAPKDLATLFSNDFFETKGLFWEMGMGLAPVKDPQMTYAYPTHVGVEALYLKARKRTNAPNPQAALGEMVPGFKETLETIEGAQATLEQESAHLQENLTGFGVSIDSIAPRQ